MLRFYIVPASEIQAAQQNQAHLLNRTHYAYIPLGTSGYMLVSTDEFSTPDYQAQWHANPNVARLHNPVSASALPLSALLSQPAKQFTAAHLTALGNLYLGSPVTPIGGTNTVVDVATAASAVHPLVRLDPAY